jgi:hypothetical protein
MKRARVPAYRSLGFGYSKEEFPTNHLDCIRTAAEPVDVAVALGLACDRNAIPFHSVLPGLATSVNTTSPGRSISATPFRSGTVPTF